MSLSYSHRKHLYIFHCMGDMTIAMHNLIVFYKIDYSWWNKLKLYQYFMLESQGREMSLLEKLDNIQDRSLACSNFISKLWTGSWNIWRHLLFPFSSSVIISKTYSTLTQTLNWIKVIIIAMEIIITQK